MTGRMKKSLSTTGRVLLLIVYLLAVILPIYWMVATSLKPHAEIIDAQNLTYVPSTPTTENYDQLFSMYNYGSMLKNSVLVSGSTAIVITLLSILGGYAFARYEFRGKGAMLLFFLVTQMIPGILVIIPLYIIFANANLINTRFSLFMYYLVVNLPFCAITMRSFFERIPYTLEEAAYVDEVAPSGRDCSRLFCPSCSRGLWRCLCSPLSAPGMS